MGKSKMSLFDIRVYHLHLLLNSKYMKSFWRILKLFSPLAHNCKLLGLFHRVTENLEHGCSAMTQCVWDMDVPPCHSEFGTWLFHCVTVSLGHGCSTVSQWIWNMAVPLCHSEFETWLFHHVTWNVEHGCSTVSQRIWNMHQTVEC